MQTLEKKRQKRKMEEKKEKQRKTGTRERSFGKILRTVHDLIDEGNS